MPYDQLFVVEHTTYIKPLVIVIRNCPLDSAMSNIHKVHVFLWLGKIMHNFSCWLMIWMRVTRFNTLRPRQMDAISQTTFSNAFSWMKIFEFRLEFYWSLFLRFQLTIFQHWFRYWLGAVEATSYYLNQWWLVYWRIYASLGLNELITPCRDYVYGKCQYNVLSIKTIQFQRKIRGKIWTIYKTRIKAINQEKTPSTP